MKGPEKIKSPLKSPLQTNSKSSQVTDAKDTNIIQLPVNFKADQIAPGKVYIPTKSLEALDFERDQIVTKKFESSLKSLDESATAPEKVESASKHDKKIKHSKNEKNEPISRRILKKMKAPLHMRRWRRQDP